ncbi:MAG: DnaA/Hda family protein [Candidatus Limivivens sp.]|nr:DnaA/Hda family protein [Candidatus Limivivens sp.]
MSKGLNERGKKVIFTSDRHPDALELCEEAKEFLKKGSILEINWPGYECRRKILDKKIKEHFLNDPEIQEEVLDYIAAHGKENVRILEGLLNKAVAMARLERVKAVDLAFAKESLEESISLIG